MAATIMDFDWLLEQASAIAFDPSRPSIYVFGLGLDAEALKEQVLTPMSAANLFTVADAKFIDGDMRGQYKGQLPRVAMTLFDVSGHQCGIILTYHEKFPPDLSQYEAWSQFWHAHLLDDAKA